MPSLRATRTTRTFLKSATRDMGSFLIVLMLLAGLTAQSSAQQVFGSITGTITDASGAGVPNATVEITETSKGVNFTTRTNGSGLYTQGQLIPGRYVVTVEAPSFARVTSSGLVVNVDQVTRFDAALPLGDVTQTVQVTSEAPLLQTDRADVATTLSSDQVIHLPTYQRSVLALEFITPGVLSNPSSTPTAENPQGSFRARVNGQIWGTTGYQLDGTDNQDAWLGSAIINPSPDSVAESKFSTQNFDAENGYVAGGMFTISTKSGTNDTHGSLFEYIINSSPGFETVAANPFTQPNGAPPLKSHQFGGSLGGHVLRKKLFYFGDVQIQRRKETDSVLTTVPTALARSTCGLGSTSSVCDLSDYLQGGTFQIYDPLTGNPSTGQARSTFASNRIPINRISPQAQRIMSYFPLPNVANASPNNIRNYIANGAQVFNSEQYNTREDFYLNEKNLFFGRYTIGNFSLAVPGAFGTLAGGPGLDSSGYSGNSRTTNQSLALGYTRIFSASLINEFRFGFYKYNVHTFPGGYGTTPATDAGIPNLNQDSSFTSGLPAFGIPTAGTTMYLGYSLTANRCNCPLAETERQYQFVDNLTKTVGNHSLKFGVDFRRTANLRVPSDGHRSGELTFAAGYTGLGNTSGGSSAGLGLATFLLGQTTTFSRYVSTVTDATAYLYRGHFFGQDTWRVTPKLTLSYGLRWELTFPESTAPGKGGLLDLNTGNVVIYGVGGNSTHGYQQMVYDNFAPRLGVSYLVTPKTVLRGGYGWAYSAGWGGSIFNQANITLPVVLAQSNTPANASQGVFDLATGPPSPIFPQTIGGVMPLPNNIVGSARPHRLTLPVVYAYNATVQQQLTQYLSLTAAYVGSSGRHTAVDTGTNINANQAAFVPGVTNTNTLKPFFAKYGWTQTIQYFCHCSVSQFNSFQASVAVNAFHGYSAQGTYLYEYAYGDSNSGNLSYTMLYNRSLGRGNFSSIPHTQVIAVQSYELPFGKGKALLSNSSSALQAVIGNWRLDGVTTFLSGLPFTATIGNYPSGYSFPSVGIQLPDRGGNSPFNGTTHDRNQWFLGCPTTSLSTGTCTSFQLPSQNTFGNNGFNNLYGPILINQDLAVTKRISITDALSGTFKADAFNVFNHTNLGLPDSVITNATAGRITGIASGSNMRRLQFAFRLEF